MSVHGKMVLGKWGGHDTGCISPARGTLLLSELLSPHPLREHAPMVLFPQFFGTMSFFKATVGVVSIKFWDIGVALAIRGGGGLVDKLAVAEVSVIRALGQTIRQIHDIKPY